MNDSFLSVLFSKLGLSKEESKQLTSDFWEIVYYNTLATLFTDLPAEKKKSLKKLFTSDRVEFSELEKWILEEKINADEAFTKKYKNVLDVSIKEYFKMLLSKLDPEQRSEAIKFSQTFK